MRGEGGRGGRDDGCAFGVCALAAAARGDLEIRVAFGSEGGHFLVSTSGRESCSSSSKDEHHRSGPLNSWNPASDGRACQAITIGGCY